MQEIIRGPPGAKDEGFFSGGLGGMSNGAWEMWGCWRKHACLDSIGLANKGEAVCYKRNSADGSWMLWGLQREIGIGCSDGWNGTANAPPANSSSPGGTLYPWPLNATKVKYLSDYHFPLAGYDAGANTRFRTIIIPNSIWATMNNQADWVDGKYFGGVLGPDG